MCQRTRRGVPGRCKRPEGNLAQSSATSDTIPTRSGAAAFTLLYNREVPQENQAVATEAVVDRLLFAAKDMKCREGLDEATHS
mmetsp:Transcript_9957/g.26108  ORF Transcript_9957/g.26108 Transcript_9957/m.26108 type:complete len:83 (-) Transcript_9957:232-480(-)